MNICNDFQHIDARVIWTSEKLTQGDVDQLCVSGWEVENMNIPIMEDRLVLYAHRLYQVDYETLVQEARNNDESFYRHGL